MPQTDPIAMAAGAAGRRGERHSLVTR